MSLYVKQQIIDEVARQLGNGGGGGSTPLANNLTTVGAGSALDARQGPAIASAIASGDSATLSTVRGGVTSAGDTLAKLYALIQSLNSIVGGTTADGDSLVNTVTELLAVFSTYSESVDIVTLINSKATGAVINALTQTAAGGVLDARQGKVLSDAIATINTTLLGLASATLQGNTFNGANQLVKLDGSGKLPGIDGSQLTNLPSSGGTATSQQTVTSGSASTLANATGTIEFYIDPASVLASYAATFPAAPVDNQRVSFHFGGTLTTGTVVTSFSVLPNSGQTVLQATTPSSVEAGEAISYIYNLSKTKWYRSY